MKRLTKQKDEAIRMRLEGASYSQIKQKINVSKSTLSFWLEKYPLTPERINELRGSNPQRIERCRNTKLLKKQRKLDEVYENAKKELSNFTKREMLIAGLFLYWGEGTKVARGTVALTNTDPSMLRFFIRWLESIGVPKNKLRCRLQLYVDMDVSERTNFWSSCLGIPEQNFHKPHIKNSRFSSLTYKTSFGHGTCTVSYNNSDLRDQIMMSLKFMREIA